MHFSPKVGLALALLTGVGLAILPAQAQGPNIVANPGFETGSFSGWTTTPAASGSDFGVVNSPIGLIVAHTGNYAADFGAVDGLDDSISQDLTTIAGDSYSISFWLENTGGPSNDFRAYFGGIPLLNNVDAGFFPYQQYTFTETATGTSTPLTFAGEHHQAFFNLDDISVNDLGSAPVPEASTTASFGLLLALGLGGLVIAKKRKQSA